MHKQPSLCSDEFTEWLNFMPLEDVVRFKNLFHGLIFPDYVRKDIFYILHKNFKKKKL
jgi:hypothetical protein